MKYEIIIRFSKKGKARFLSHLDLLRVFQRCARRAEVPVALTQGFVPRMKMSIIPAIKLGVESDRLEAKFTLTQKIEKDQLKQKLQEQLPLDLTIEEVKENNV